MKNCHFIGIGGIGMSGLARIMLAKNMSVSGSDLTSNLLTEQLSRDGAKIYKDHSAKYVTEGTTVVFSSGVKSDNPEYQAALALKCPLLHRSDLLLKLTEGYRTLAVTGTHGKTTTSALLASVLLEAKQNPCFAIGGVLPQIKSNAGYGEGTYFVAEADESDGTFLKYDSFGAIVTNIDCDHMDFFKTEDELVKAFKIFIDKVKDSKHLFWCGEDERLRTIADRGISYGFTENCQLRGSHFKQIGWSVFFDIHFNGKTYQSVELPLGGYHNALNALGVFGLCITLGIAEDKIRAGFKNFQGVQRRSERKGNAYGIDFLDDYGHHPTEIKATLKSIRKAIGEKRLIAIYQPHRYTRTQDTLGKFGDTFEEADVVVITDIYAAGEMPITGLHAKDLVREVRGSQYISRSGLADQLTRQLRPHDVVVSFGAGDITKTWSEFQQHFKLQTPPKLKVGVVFGGRSSEHEISLKSAKNIVSSLRRELYDLSFFGISKEGKWSISNELLEGIGEKKEFFPSQVFEALMQCELIIPVLHGPYGEDGTIQGFFEILDKPFVGCDHRSAAICMDKALTKRLMQLNGIPTPDFIAFNLYEWKSDKQHWIQLAQEKLTFPMFVKPSHLGSTVGISKVTNAQEIEKAVDDAARFDTEFLIENGLTMREIEFSVLGNDVTTLYPPGEIISDGKVYTYEAKYGPQATKAIPTTDLSPELVEKGMELAKRAYEAAGCCGMARVDTFLDQNNQYWLNEINPIPGFTKNSLYPLICAHNGLKQEDLLDRLIVLAMQRHRQMKALEV